MYRGDQDVRRSYSLGAYVTLFQAEVFAILMVVQSKEVKACSGQNIAICSDSQAALKTVCANRIRSNLVAECADALGRIRLLGWVPDNIGTLGNKQADELARQGDGAKSGNGIAREQISSALNELS